MDSLAKDFLAPLGAGDTALVDLPADDNDVYDDDDDVDDDDELLLSPPDALSSGAREARLANVIGLAALCVICRQLLTEPVTVGCGHTFCSDCIKQASGAHFCCPRCRRIEVSHAVDVCLRDLLDALRRRLSVQQQQQHQLQQQQRPRSQFKAPLLCPICYSAFRDPITTPCGHSFCRDCLRAATERTRSCPTCRTDMTVGPGAWRSNLVLTAIVRVLHQPSPAASSADAAASPPPPQREAYRGAPLTITVLRNRLELPSLMVPTFEDATLNDLLPAVIDRLTAAQQQQQDEQPLLPTASTDGHPLLQQQHYRFRRVAYRKNATKRPMNFYDPAVYNQSLADLKLTASAQWQRYLYLEQSPDPFFDGLDSDATKVFFTLRKWDAELRRTVSVRDVVLPKSTTFGEFKRFASSLVAIPPAEMVVVEEETELVTNIVVLDDEALIHENRFFCICDGDIVHIERLSPAHCLGIDEVCFAHAGAGRVAVINETPESLQRRQFLEPRATPLSLRVPIGGVRTVEQLKKLVAVQTGIDRTRLILYHVLEPGGESRFLEDKPFDVPDPDHTLRFALDPLCRAVHVMQLDVLDADD